MTDFKRVLIAAGGTGGHVFPGLALAHYFREQQIEVFWLGTLTGLEARVVQEAGFPIHFISIKGLRGKGIKNSLLFPWRLIYAIFQALKYIRALNPDVVIGMGGFVSAPGGIASVILGKKLIIHEQNAKPGLANQWLARIAYKVLEGFPNTFRNRSNVVTAGNPVRTEIANLPPPGARMDKVHLLVLGGSLGARVFNQLVPEVLANMPDFLRPEVMHQTGEAEWEQTRKRYETLNVSATVLPFIKEMDQAYTWASMVLCRAGALTITELCAAGLGAVLVPYPYAVDDHQTANAQFMVKQGAALLVQQSGLTVAVLTSLLTDFCASAEKRLQMAKSAYELRKTDAVQTVFTICKEIGH